MLHTEISGDIPDIIRNDEELYEENLVHYFQVFEHAFHLALLVMG